MRTTTIFCFLLLTLLSCQSQNNNPETDRIVGGSCEGCEATLEYGNRVLNSVDTIPDFEQNDPKLKLSGTVYQQDGKTPAAGVILYFHQTNRDGIYPPRKGDTGWARRHGYHHS
ncbi:MAG: intradiol ring-cleavage dioxygenase, partial [Bacteroidia bacterium]|nr:intradiol ring-cleavage dioxygenase [Bacteroidia bacterium]